MVYPDKNLATFVLIIVTDWEGPTLITAEQTIREDVENPEPQ